MKVTAINEIDNKSYVLESLQPNNNIEDIKRRIQTKAGIPSADITLKLNGEIFKKPDFMIKDSKIKDNSVLYFSYTQKERINITVIDINDLQTEIRDLRLTDKLSVLMEQVEYKLGIPKTTQKLLFMGKVMRNEDQTIADYKLRDGCKIHLVVGNLIGGSH